MINVIFDDFLTSFLIIINNFKMYEACIGKWEYQA